MCACTDYQISSFQRSFCGKMHSLDTHNALFCRFLACDNGKTISSVHTCFDCQISLFQRSFPIKCTVLDAQNDILFTNVTNFVVFLVCFNYRIGLFCHSFCKDQNYISHKCGLFCLADSMPSFSNASTLSNILLFVTKIIFKR